MPFPSLAPTRVRHPLRQRMLQVARVEAVSPRMRRVIFTGDDLRDFVTSAPDDHVKLVFPLLGDDRPVRRETAPEGSPGSDPSVPHVMRQYTPRAFDPRARELAIEFVLHGHGPATRWAAQACPGQWLGMGGPKGSLLVPDIYQAWLLIGDETALPAIARRLEEMPAGRRVTALIEVADAQEKRPLATKADATIQWLPRKGIAAGRSELLQEALWHTSFPARSTYIWIGAEIETARTLRDILIRERGVSREQVRAAGYWRHGVADGGSRVED
ncbi:siderophore-interacting protein [Brytella acorum]|uniref:Siderophore-interacting protein n=1 Tax=Brytella acorum TaxID=2959299 RepID=A0AA35VF38_9PROT|nr:siderophore-interacting protein [Brytella acorum]MDF3625139.1 siderophore-interacting protein [Brytella acorum]CAI9122039.1 siderophore-interacting protein [Brytella acorum]